MRYVCAILLISLCLSSYAAPPEWIAEVQALIDAGKNDAALDALAAKIEDVPNNQKHYAWTMRAGIFKGKQDYESAKADLNSALTLFKSIGVMNSHPWKGQIHRELAVIAMIEQDFAAAKANYLIVLYSARGDEIVYASVAWLSATSADDGVLSASQAVRLAEKAVKAERNAVTLEVQAAAFARSGDYQEAVIAQKAAIAMAVADKTQSDAQRNLRAERLSLYQASKPYTDNRTPALALP